MMQNEKNIIIGFTTVTVLMGLFILYKVISPVHFFLPVKMVIMRQNGSITNMNEARNPSYTQYFKIPAIDFPEGTKWVQREMGPYGHQNDFFADFYTAIHAKKEGYYIFSVSSDDGFILWMDDVKLGEFLTDRGYTKNQFKFYITPGLHHFKLSYFQGYGRLGLKAEYQLDGEKETFLIGKNSRYFDFSFLNGYTPKILEPLTNQSIIVPLEVKNDKK